MTKEDLQKIRSELLQECPSCDMGLPYACVCPPAELDWRPIVANLVNELEGLREQDDRAKRALEDPRELEGMSRRRMALYFMRLEEQRARYEAQLSQYLEQIEAYRWQTGYTPEQITHIHGCTECGIEPPQAPEYCRYYTRELHK